MTPKKLYEIKKYDWKQARFRKSREVYKYNSGTVGLVIRGIIHDAWNARRAYYYHRAALDKAFMNGLHDGLFR